jgi:hypothetical protein
MICQILNAVGGQGVLGSSAPTGQLAPQSLLAVRHRQNQVRLHTEFKIQSEATQLAKRL